MNRYTGSIEIFNGRFVRQHKAEVQASNWPMAVKRAVTKAVNENKAASRKRTKIESITIKLQHVGRVTPAVGEDLKQAMRDAVKKSSTAGGTTPIGSGPENSSPISSRPGNSKPPVPTLANGKPRCQDVHHTGRQCVCEHGHTTSHWYSTEITPESIMPDDKVVRRMFDRMIQGGAK